MWREGARAQPVPHIQDDAVLEWKQRQVFRPILYVRSWQRRAPKSSAAEVCARGEASRQLDLHRVQLDDTYLSSMPAPAARRALVSVTTPEAKSSSKRLHRDVDGEEIDWDEVEIDWDVAKWRR